MVKLSSYIVAVDSGFAPNPFGRHCTLACCKPTIRRKAQLGDIIVGVGSARAGLAGRLIYAMRIGSILPFEEYWKDPTFAYKKPTSATPISRCGDNIWHRDATNEWRCASGSLHNECHRDRDIQGQQVLIAKEFFYFGREAIPVPREFAGLLPTTQGHKNTRDFKVINRFWEWLHRTAPKTGRNGDPSLFAGVSC